MELNKNLVCNIMRLENSPFIYPFVKPKTHVHDNA